MTLCVAAACIEDDAPRVVIGTDWRVEGALAAGAEIQEKLYWINDDIFVLIAGKVTRAIELRDVYRDILRRMEKNNDPLTKFNIRRWIRQAPKLYHKHRVDDEVGGMMGGLTFQEFLGSVSRKEIPDTIAGPVFRRVERTEIGCSLIVVAYVDGAFYIFRVDPDGDVDECDNFAAIGEGIGIADGWLYFRASNSDDDATLQIYQVWEAMTIASQCVSTVGKNLTVNLIYPPGVKGKHVCGDVVTSTGEKFLRGLYRDRFGPRKIAYVPSLPEKGLAPDFEEDEPIEAEDASMSSDSQTSEGETK